MGLRWRTGDRMNIEDRRGDLPPDAPEIADAVDGATRMTERQILVDELIRDEGFRTKPYQDTGGVWTVGVGRNLTGKGLSSEEVLLLLGHDIDEAIRDLATFPWFAELDPVRQRVVTNMRFNLGPTRFRSFKRMLAALAAGDYAAAANSMRQSLWAAQVKTRATRLIRMMQTGAV